MQYKCDFCQDTGSMHHDSDILDCTHCNSATQRAAMNDFLDKLPAMGDYDAAWLVHQRALAMAPKKVRRPVHEENARHAIDAAILFGRNGTNKPPTDDHWLMQYWNMGAQLTMAPKQEAPEQKPVAWLVYAEDHNGMVPQHPAYATHLHATRCASMFGQTPTEVRPLYDHAAPVAANGALPDLPPGTNADEYCWDLPVWTEGKVLAYGRACAAAGPDAALVELIQKHWNGAYFQGVTKAEAREINEVLALSGAKGN